MIAASHLGVVAQENCFGDIESYQNLKCGHCDDVSVVRANA